MASSTVDAYWTRDEAIILIAQLEGPLKKVGWAIALTGSVLTRGASKKDLDLVLYPYATNNADKVAAKGALEEGGLTLVHDEYVVKRTWRRQGSKDAKHVEVWADKKSRRVDVFFLR